MADPRSAVPTPSRPARSLRPGLLAIRALIAEAVVVIVVAGAVAASNGKGRQEIMRGRFALVGAGVVLVATIWAVFLGINAQMM